MNDFRRALYETSANAGLKIISDDKCCRLLAWLYVYGGGNEQTIEGRLKDAILYAQKRLKIEGSETPDSKTVQSIQGYIKDIAGENTLAFFTNAQNSKYYNPPEWVIEIEKEYGIKPHRQRLFKGDGK
jgi:hypothetical protein